MVRQLLGFVFLVCVFFVCMFVFAVRLHFGQPQGVAPTGVFVFAVRLFVAGHLDSHRVFSDSGFT